MKTQYKLACLTAGLLAGPLVADVIRIYDSFDTPGMHNFTAIKTGTNFETTWGALITPTNPMGHPAGFRIWSYESGSYSRADATIELAGGLTGGFRVSYMAYNQNYFWIDSGLRKVSLRAANPGVAWDVINASSANYQNLVEVITDGTVAGAWNRVNETGTAKPRYVTDPGGGVGPDPIPLTTHTFDLIVNASGTEDFTYVLHGKQRTLHPYRMDLFIDGALATPEENPNGTIFENKASFDPALGFGTFSFTTATASHMETDFVLDRMYIYTDEDVSEGEVEDKLIDILIADSTPFVDGFYSNPLIGLIWADGQSNWFSTLDNWALLVNADDTAYWVYDVLHDEWVYLPKAAPGYVYNYTTEEWEW